MLDFSPKAVAVAVSVAENNEVLPPSAKSDRQRSHVAFSSAFGTNKKGCLTPSTGSGSVHLMHKDGSVFAGLKGFEIPDFTAVRDPYVLANTTFMHTAYTKTVAYLPDAGDGVGGPVWVDHAQGERRLARQQLLSADLDGQSARHKTVTGGSAHLRKKGAPWLLRSAIWLRIKFLIKVHGRPSLPLQRQLRYGKIPV